ncbi:hypothetical protein Nepgr_026963 [Nepenthes gracilis]|uniref:Uncharacterized protein n=1 Tax=Nepenthes gracilis TaxID=150966 RepID=A0AAD3T919_NEPGR|nr:hypothetical protein Nepgr_026963 [Nepenthes gracilis]
MSLRPFLDFIRVCIFSSGEDIIIWAGKSSGNLSVKSFFLALEVDWKFLFLNRDQCPKTATKALFRFAEEKDLGSSSYFGFRSVSPLVSTFFLYFLTPQKKFVFFRRSVLVCQTVAAYETKSQYLLGCYN